MSITEKEFENAYDEVANILNKLSPPSVMGLLTFLLLKILSKANDSNLALKAFKEQLKEFPHLIAEMKKDEERK